MIDTINDAKTGESALIDSMLQQLAQAMLDIQRALPLTPAQRRTMRRRLDARRRSIPKQEWLRHLLLLRASRELR